jgi:hypothetical protein
MAEWAAHTTEDGIRTTHATLADAKRAANERTGRIAGYGWDKPATYRVAGVAIAIHEKAERDGRELLALVFPAFPLASQLVEEMFGIEPPEAE